MKLIKLLFHHDLPLQESAPEPDLLALFAAPQLTGSRLWLSASEVSAQSYSLSTCAFHSTILDALALGLSVERDLLTGILQEPVVFRLSADSSYSITRKPNSLHIHDLLQADPSALFIQRISGKNGYDLEFLSRTNVHGRVFNALAPLTGLGYSMWSINGKRVHKSDQLYLETTATMRLPHGFETVQPHFRL